MLNTIWWRRSSRGLSECLIGPGTFHKKHLHDPLLRISEWFSFWRRTPRLLGISMRGHRCCRGCYRQWMPHPLPWSGHLSPPKWISHTESYRKNRSKHHRDLIFLWFAVHGIFENKILTFSETERSILGRIIAEARNCFETPLDDPYLEQMIKKPEISFGSQQLLTLYLEELLIHVIRRYTIAHYSASAGIYDPCQTTSDTCRKIIHYLEQHVRETLTIQDISRNNMIGRSQLQNFSRRISVWCDRIFLTDENRLCQAAYPGKWDELYADLRFPELFFDPLFFQAVQEAVRNDTDGIRHFYQGTVWTPTASELIFMKVKTI